MSTGQKVRVGAVGCGVVASAYYFPYLMDMENVELTAVCDLNKKRADECMRLFGAKASFSDYYEMLDKAEVDAVFILTGPGTHAKFALEAIARGKHILLQKPMATNMDDANAITDAVRDAGLVAVVEPSKSTILDEDFMHMKEIVDAGALGDPYWFNFVPIGPDHYHPVLSGNPYGVGAFYSKDSGGMVFDYPYGPTQIVTLLGDCKSVSGMAKISVPDREVVPDSVYDDYLKTASDPRNSNYWDVVVDEPRTQEVKMEAPDNAFSVYEMTSGALGVYHVGRLFHPMPKGSTGGGLEIFGTDGNLIFDRSPYTASIISSKKDLLPSTDKDGWYHIPKRGDQSKAKWPQPTPGSFHYYHRSSQHFIDCIVEGKDPVVNVEWGRHITEMMYGVLESSRTGKRYEMTTTTTGLVEE